MGDTLVRSPSSRQAGAFRARRSSGERSHKTETHHHQRASKYVTGALGLTAQNNPNWRSRPNTDSSSSTDHGYRAGKRDRQDQSSPCYPHNDFRSHHGLGGQIENGEAESAETPQRFDSSEDEGFYQVYKHIDLGPLGYDGRCLSLIDVIPAHPGGKNPIIKIERFPREVRESCSISENTQKQQLTAALRAGASTPRKGQTPKGARPLPPLPVASAPVHDPTNSQAALPPVDMPKSSTNLASFDSAFQKMLQKLTRNAETPRQDDAGMRIEDRAGTEAEKLRYPIPGSGRRVDTSSDPCAPYHCPGVQMDSHKKEDTKDSGVSLGENVKTKTLNPRAREFLTNQELLSLKHRPYVGTSTESDRSSEAFAPGPFSKSLGEGFMVSLGNNPTKNDTSEGASQYQPLPPMATVTPLISGTPSALGYGVPPIVFNSAVSNGNLLPVASDQLQRLGSTTPLGSLPGLTTPSVLQPIAANLLGYPSTAPILHAFLPNITGTINPCLPVAARPLPAAGSAAARPSPVPKPRRPDPGDQQAYEAWIEWRKANEPGYALECKLRQQRRAQRSIADGLKTKTVTKAEVSSAA